MPDVLSIIYLSKVHNMSFTKQSTIVVRENVVTVNKARYQILSYLLT
jgi:hypothetical protein